MKNIKAVFFDLDHTLWDYDRNSRETLHELFNKHSLAELGVVSSDLFVEDFIRINHMMWDKLHKGYITKQQLRKERFKHTLELYNIKSDDIVEKLIESYMEECPKKDHVFPGAIETLSYLQKKYSLSIITNGFKEAQYKKLLSGNLQQYFTHIHISEEVGFSKPEPQIFHHAVKYAKVNHQSCVMIGDNIEVDIAGANHAGINSILFDPHQKYDEKIDLIKISRLTELTELI